MRRKTAHTHSNKQQNACGMRIFLKTIYIQTVAQIVVQRNKRWFSLCSSMHLHENRQRLRFLLLFEVYYLLLFHNRLISFPRIHSKIFRGTWNSFDYMEWWVIWFHLPEWIVLKILQLNYAKTAICKLTTSQEPRSFCFYLSTQLWLYNLMKYFMRFIRSFFAPPILIRYILHLKIIMSLNLAESVRVVLTYLQVIHSSIYSNLFLAQFIVKLTGLLLQLYSFSNRFQFPCAQRECVLMVSAYRAHTHTAIIIRFKFVWFCSCWIVDMHLS